jgi:apolipoprotein N-acyltransferase
MLRLPARSAFYCASAFSLGFMGSLLIWIRVFGSLPWMLLAIFQSLFMLAFFLIGRYTVLRSRYWAGLIFLPALWVVMEWLR